MKRQRKVHEHEIIVRDMMTKAPSDFSEADHIALNKIIFGTFLLKSCSCVERFFIDEGVDDLFDYCKGFWNEHYLIWPDAKPIPGFKVVDSEIRRWVGLRPGFFR